MEAQSLCMSAEAQVEDGKESKPTKDFITDDDIIVIIKYNIQS